MFGLSVTDTLLQEIYLGFVRIHVLHHAAEGPVYGLGLIQELRRHGYSFSPGTMYPMLKRLVGAGCLRETKGPESDRPRKYYRITPEGRRILKAAQVKLRELAGEVVGA
jgi:PadR family transcriptional regulator, regulatory protein PadR